MLCKNCYRTSTASFILEIIHSDPNLLWGLLIYTYNFIANILSLDVDPELLDSQNLRFVSPAIFLATIPFENFFRERSELLLINAPHNRFTISTWFLSEIRVIFDFFKFGWNRWQIGRLSQPFRNRFPTLSPHPSRNHKTNLALMRNKTGLSRTFYYFSPLSPSSATLIRQIIAIWFHLSFPRLTIKGNYYYNYYWR